MKFKELVQLGKEELDKKLKELELELIKLNAQVATGTPPKNAGQLKRIKKDLARIMLLKGTEKKVHGKGKELVNEKTKRHIKTAESKLTKKQAKKQNE